MLVKDSDSLVNGVAIKSTYSCLPKVKKKVQKTLRCGITKVEGSGLLREELGQRNASASTNLNINIPGRYL